VQNLASLLGEVLYSATAGAGNGLLSYPNLQGNFIVTLNSSDSRSGGQVAFTPYGSVYPATALMPQNLDGHAEEGVLGADGKLTDTASTTPIVWMGARVYSPAEGRFLSVDSIEGGCANLYVYVKGDPINSGDPTGDNTCTHFVDNTRYGVVSGSIVGDTFEWSYVVTVGKGYPGFGCNPKNPASLCGGPAYATDTVNVSINGQTAGTVNELFGSIDGGTKAGIGGTIPVSSGSGPPIEITLTFTITFEQSTGPGSAAFEVTCTG